MTGSDKLFGVMFAHFGECDEKFLPLRPYVPKATKCLSSIIRSPAKLTHCLIETPKLMIFNRKNYLLMEVMFDHSGNYTVNFSRYDFKY